MVAVAQVLIPDQLLVEQQTLAVAVVVQTVMLAVLHLAQAAPALSSLKFQTPLRLSSPAA
jgi:hypothetical protein